MNTAKKLEIKWKNWKDSFGSFIEYLDNKNVEYLSHSRISTIERCEKCYKREYIDGEKIDFDAAETGRLIHQAAEIVYNAIKEDEKLSSKTIKKQLRLKHSNRGRQSELNNGIKTLIKNRWKGYKILSIEKPIFSNLSKELPPVIGVIDLLLEKDKYVIVVDHKTGRKFQEKDNDQLILYSNYVMNNIKPKPRACAACFDEIRLVEDLSSVRDTVFRRTPVPLSEIYYHKIVRRYTKGWKAIKRIENGKKPKFSSDCFICNGWY